MTKNMYPLSAGYEGLVEIVSKIHVRVELHVEMCEFLLLMPLNCRQRCIQCVKGLRRKDEHVPSAKPNIALNNKRAQRIQ